jgi:spermidine synthase
MLYLLVFLSGLAGLVYEILWMKQLGLLFGSTSQAAATTFAAFFAGLAAGSWFWGKRAAKMKNPLRVYAGLEIGIATTALLYFVVLGLFYRIYPSLYQNVNSPALLLAAKFGLALLLIFPPSFCMGGTIPVMAQHVIRKMSSFGKTSALLYGINTLGAALGAFLAGFHLPLWLGFRGTCMAAMAVTGVVACTAWRLAGTGVRSPAVAKAMAGTQESGVKKKKSKRDSLNLTRDSRLLTPGSARRTILPLCFLSGFGMLALEVVWTRMFAQVLENSVYTFSVILVVVLLCLAAGAYFSSLLAKLRVAPLYLLAVLALMGGVAVMVTPLVFMHLTDSMQILVSKGSWASYVMLIFRNVSLTIAPPALLLGMVFPYLMKVEERHAESAGQSLGRMSAINTLGAILGSLLCGFVFLGTLGMWRTMQVISLVYLVAAVLIPTGRSYASIVLKVAGGIVIVSQLILLDPSDLPVTSVDKMRHSEVILETWEGSDCTVAMAEDRYGMSIKINSHYGLGSTGAMMQEKLQADVPLMIYPQTESIFFLGMGTGITAGSALDPQHSNVTRIVTCELVPEVITAAKKYLTNIEGFDFTGGLFSDPRATVLAEDGRHYLMAANDSFDMINSDLFVPYRSGAGSLYSKEHFESAKDSLEPGGVFFQWLPLYQLTESEVMIITRTMLEVFDQVTLWRNNFQPGEEVVALAGHADKTPLPACNIDNRANKRLAVQGRTRADLTQLALPFDPQTILFFYCGNVTEASDLFDDYPVNTDDRPLIEYMAPRTYRNLKDTATPWFVGPRIARLVEAIQRACPPETDPFLVNRSPANRKLPAAGIAFHRARIWDVIGNDTECRKAWIQFLRNWIPQESGVRSQGSDPLPEARSADWD